VLCIAASNQIHAPLIPHLRGGLRPLHERRQPPLRGGVLEIHRIRPRVFGIVATGRDHPAVGALEILPMIGITANPVAAFVYQSVMVAAQQHEVGQAGLAAVAPVLDMMGVDEVRVVAAGKRTATVP